MSTRKPSATLAIILTSQLQFLATLSLVDYYTIDGEPWLLDLGTHLRWLNLWWPASSSDGNTSWGSTSRRRLTLSSTCDWEDNGSYVSVKNLALVAGILVSIFLLHLVFLSGTEAYKMLKKRAKIEWEGAQRRRMTDSEIRARLSGKTIRHKVLPMANDDPDTDCGETVLSPEPPTSLSTPRATTNLWPAFSAVEKDTSRGKIDRDQEKGVSDELWQQQDVPDPIVKCRDRSPSLWLHFPHVELGFLIFAFEGFIAAQVFGVRQTGCLPVSITAAIVLALCPILLIVGIFRTTLVRVWSGVVVEFRRLPNEESTDGGVISRSITGWRQNKSIFSWADKGRWHTVETSDEGLRRERNWFRIGFEPTFVDFTQSGTWFTVMFLLEWAMLACVAVLFDSSVVQLFAFCGIHLGAFVLLAMFRPFANKVMDFMASMVAFINSVSMALLAAIAVVQKDTPGTQGIQNAAALLQLLVLCVLVVPIYVDVVAVVIVALNRKIVSTKSNTRPNAKQEEENCLNEHTFVRRFIRHTWVKTWCSLLGHLLRAYIRDIRESIRKPHTGLRQEMPSTDLEPTSHAASEPSFRTNIDASCAACSWRRSFRPGIWSGRGGFLTAYGADSLLTHTIDGQETRNAAQSMAEEGIQSDQSSHD
ncbi:unnamed protein product [Ascophyllum nodosum]